MKDSITINVTGIDDEIAGLESQIAKLNEQIAFRQQLKAYAQKNSGAGESTPKSKTATPKKATRMKRTVAKRGKVTDFVIDYIAAHPGTAARPVAEAYASELGKPQKEATNIIYNTLSRLKKMEKIEANTGENGSGLTYTYVSEAKPAKRGRKKKSVK